MGIRKANRNRIISNKQIKTIFDNYLDVNISNKSKSKRYSSLRYLYFFMCRKYSSDFTYTSSSAVVNLDHSSVGRGLEIASEMIETDPSIRKTYIAITHFIELYTKKKGVSDENDLNLIMIIEKLQEDILRLEIELEKKQEGFVSYDCHKLVSEISEMTYDQMEEYYHSRWKNYKLMNLKKTT